MMFRPVPFVVFSILLLSAAASLHGGVTIRWNDNSNNELGFKIERALLGWNFSRIVTVGANVTSYTDNRLFAGQIYRYRVCAYNAAGDSGYSNIVTHEIGTVAEEPELGAISNQTFSSSQSSLSVELVFGGSTSTTSGSQPLIVASSSNPDLIPHPEVRSDQRSLLVKRTNNRHGQATISVAASNGQRVTYQRFTVTVPRSASGSVSIEAVPRSARASSDARLINVSARALVGTDSHHLVVGFNMTEQRSTVLVRAAGPGLSSFVGDTALVDPILSLYYGNLLLDENQEWESSTGVSEAGSLVGAFPFKTTSRDAGLLQRLQPGSYTAEVRGAENRGVVLAELYHVDWETALPGRLSNLSSRADIDGSHGSLVVGFTIQGTSPLPLLVRAVGRSLSEFGVAGAIKQPRLTLYRGERQVAVMEQWQPRPDLIEASYAAGAFPLTYLSDSVMLLSLQPGSYTAQISGADGSGGVVLAELYELP